MATGEKKVFVGGRLKRLRRERGSTQAAMAAELRVSPSYFNLLERNQRPVTAQVLLRLAEVYDLDLRSLTADESAGEAGLNEVFADKMFADLSVGRREIADFIEAAPVVAEAMVRLYRAFLDRGALVDLGAFDSRDGVGANPAEWVRDLVTAQHNHFAELEKLAERTTSDLNGDSRDLMQWTRQRLQDRFGVRMRIMPTEAMAGVLRKFDRHRKQLLIAESLAAPGCLFAAAYTLALLEHGEAISALADRFEPPDATRRNQLKVYLGNYLAAAIMMPYVSYLAALERTGYDLERVRTHFGASFEQAAQRLTTLARPGARAIPFFMVRIDAAGNISKRFSSGSFPFSRFGGTCPRWNVHDSFKTPGRVITQVIETPDGERYFTMSRTVRRVAGLLAGLEDELAVGLGCELRYADKLIYSRGLNMISPAIVEVGPACRICERVLCPQRAATPVNKAALVVETTKSVTSFPFRA
jgi:predicted transcriptional regulator